MIEFGDGGFDMIRRFAMKILLPLLLVVSVIEWKARAGETLPLVELGPMLGYVGPEQARIWIKASAPATGGAIVGEGADLQQGRAVTGPDLKAESDCMGVIHVTGLRPATQYFYKTTLNGKPDTGSPHSFVTAPSEGSKGHFRFAVISCIGDLEKHIQWAKTSVMAAWRALADVPVNFVLQLGDNVYAGSTEPEVQRRMYYWHRRLPPYRQVMAVTPMLAIWDDWDYAGNDSAARLLGSSGRCAPSKNFGPIHPTASHRIPASISSSPGAMWIFSCSTFATTDRRTVRKMMVKRRCWAGRS